MRAFFQIFRLTVLSLVRSHVVTMLAVAALAWTFGLPYLIHGDGTTAGECQLYVQYALGGVCFMLTVALAATAAGALAKDRAARRLPLTLVRPAPYAVLHLGRLAALTVLGAGIMALAAVSMTVRLISYPKSFARADGSAETLDFSCMRPCYHVLSPLLPKSARQEAEEAYEKYRVDPATSNNVAAVNRADAIEILTQRAEERYDAIPAATTSVWRFAAVPEATRRLAVRMKFSNGIDAHGDFHGRFVLGDAVAVVSNVTEAVLIAPLVRGSEGPVTGPLRFVNASASHVMLRPRKDLQLLYGCATDVYIVNLFHAYLASVAMMSLVISGALLLSACLSRSVAVFTALVLLLAAEIAPSILDECREDQAGGLGDRIGIRITNAVGQATRAIGSVHPIESLAHDECVETGEVLRACGVNFVIFPLVCAFLAACVLPAKSEP